ncbi:hypothetical protein I79_025711 [Cricetulus griseus]|uniref:Secreted protein n=1 Tax=Cricetulus griseus TaxID=10029 RepID=G3IP12_CRIGR|nr:hypothetical protein I79_025711 [Cricetulus griseus]
MMFIAHLLVGLAWLTSPFSSCPSFTLSNEYFSRKMEKEVLLSSCNSVLLSTSHQLGTIKYLSRLTVAGLS